jgi:hypothetical protein
MSLSSLNANQPLAVADDIAYGLCDLSVATWSYERINPADVRKLIAVARDHAARHNQPADLAPPTPSRRFADGAETLGTGGLQEAARIDDDDIGSPARR